MRSNQNLGTVNILNFNVNGLMSKLESPDCVKYINRFDFVCLTETFIEKDLKSPLLAHYVIFSAKAKKLSRQGRYSGGVVVLAKKKYAHLVSRVECNMDNIVILKINKSLFNLDLDLLWICTYIPPIDSPSWKCSQDGWGIERLEQCLLDVNNLQMHHVLLCGDFNSRTGSENYTGIEESFVSVHDAESTKIDQFVRLSEDVNTNAFGEQLLELCNSFDIVILN